VKEHRHMETEVASRRLRRTREPPEGNEMDEGLPMARVFTWA
jgi:hypothetical protein